MTHGLMRCSAEFDPETFYKIMENDNAEKPRPSRMPVEPRTGAREGERKYLTENEVLRLLEASRAGRHSVRDSCLIFWMYRRGWRVSEACSCLLSDIDLEGRVIYVKRGKNGVNTTHPIAPDEYKALRAWLKERARYRGADTSKFLFLSERGTALDRSQVNYLLAKYGKLAGLPIKPNPHALRHACGYKLANDGHDTRALQTYLGHRSISSTTIYTETNVGRFMEFWR